MKRLWIQRHARAASGWPGADDHERPLAESGDRDAERAGRQLLAWNRPPERVICSSAVRTETTASIVALTVGLDGAPHADPQLYSGSPATYLAAIRLAGDGVGNLLVVGHNPVVF